MCLKGLTAVSKIWRAQTGVILSGFKEQPGYICFFSKPGSSVGIATELRAGRSGIKSRWGQDIPSAQTDPGAHPASCKMGTGSFQGGKVRPRRAANHSPLSSAAVMEDYSYTSTHPLGHTGPVTGSLYPF